MGVSVGAEMPAPFSDDQEELRRYARQWLDERSPLGEVRRIMETDEGFDHTHWSELAELGWLGIAIGEEYGGAGYGFGELAVLAEEMGRSLFPSPFLATVVWGASLVAALGNTEQRSRILEGVVQGNVRLAVAIAEPGGGQESDVETRAAADGGAWTIDGTKSYVLDGHTADILLVLTSTESGAGVFIVEGSDPGISRRRLDVMDLTRPLAEIHMNGARGERLGEGSPEPALAAAQDRAIGILAMEQVGGAQACLDMAVAYSQERHQFGRPIGSFQAIKHMCADMLVLLESARSAAYHLASVVDDDPEETAYAVPVAKSYCSDAYFRIAADTIQVHGGIGFTWEHDAHLFLKRAKASQLLFGDGTAHRRRLSRRIGVG